MSMLITTVTKDSGPAELALRFEQHPEAAVAGYHNHFTPGKQLCTYEIPSDAASIHQSDLNEFSSDVSTENFIEDWCSEYKSLVPDGNRVIGDKTRSSRDLFSRISGAIADARRRRREDASQDASAPLPPYSFRRRLAPLHYAIRRGDTLEVKRLVGLGFDINIKISRTGPLQYAIVHNDLAMAKVLVDLGADVNGVDQLGISPLVIAIRRDNFETVRLLADLGANINAVNSKAGSTPLVTAIHRNNVEMVKLLVELGADIHTPFSYGWTPLIHAISSGSVGAVRLMVDLGVDLKRPTPSGVTPLSLASRLSGAERDSSERSQRYTNILNILNTAMEPGRFRPHTIDTTRGGKEDSHIKP